MPSRLLLLLQGAALCASLRLPINTAPKRQTLAHATSNAALTAACAASLLLGAPPALAAHVDQVANEASVASVHMAPVSEAFAKLILPPANAEVPGTSIPTVEEAFARKEEAVKAEAERVAELRANREAPALWMLRKQGKVDEPLVRFNGSYKQEHRRMPADVGRMGS